MVAADRRRAALERHVHRGDLGDLLEEILGRDMRAAADAGRGEGDALALRRFQEIGEVGGRIAWAGDQRLGRGRHDGDRLQVVGGESLVRAQRLVDRHRRGGDQQRVAVGRRARDRRGGDIAAGAAAIFHDHRPPQSLAQALADEARQRIGDAARREGDDEGDIARRVGLRARLARALRAQQRGQCERKMSEKTLARHIDPPAAPVVMVFAKSRGRKLFHPARGLTRFGYRQLDRCRVFDWKRGMCFSVRNLWNINESAREPLKRSDTMQAFFVDRVLAGFTEAAEHHGSDDALGFKDTIGC